MCARKETGRKPCGGGGCTQPEPLCACMKMSLRGPALCVMKEENAQACETNLLFRRGVAHWKSTCRHMQGILGGFPPTIYNHHQN